MITAGSFTHLWHKGNDGFPKKSSHYAKYSVYSPQLEVVVPNNVVKTFDSSFLPRNVKIKEPMDKTSKTVIMNNAKILANISRVSIYSGQC